MDKKLIKINILTPARFLTFRKLEPFSASGLLCECEYDDGSKEFLPQPYIEIPRFNKSGEYSVKIYKNENEKDIYTEYKVNYIKNDEDLKNMDTKEIVEVEHYKKGVFVTDGFLKELYFDVDGNKTMLFLFDKKLSKKQLIKQAKMYGDLLNLKIYNIALEEAKKQHINIEWVDL